MENIYAINSNIDVEMAVNHEFIKDNNLVNDYCALQKKYYLTLELYLSEKLGLKGIESNFDNSKYYFNNKNDLARILGFENITLNYFFIRNNLNIEVLSENELDILKNSDDMNQLFELIENTFLKVIKVNFLYGQRVENTRILYDGTSSDFLKHNSSLVVGFLNDLMGKKIPDEDWDSFLLKREQIKNEAFKYIENEVSNKLNCKVEFIEYSLDMLKELRNKYEYKF